MKINELENTLKEIDQPKAPEFLTLNILKYAEERSDAEMRSVSRENGGNISILNKLLTIIAELIPFYEIYWYFNEKFIKRNDIKIVLIPKDNEIDLAEIPEKVKDGLTIIPINSVAAAVRYVIPELILSAKKVKSNKKKK